METTPVKKLTIEDLSKTIGELESRANPTETEEISLLACKKLMDVLHTMQEKDMSIHRLSKMLFGKKTEKEKKSKRAVDQNGDQSKTDKGPKKKRKSRNTGRLSPEDYKDAGKVTCPHGSLTKGDTCPECEKGKLYKYPMAEEVIIEGQAPLKATRVTLERLRCNACGALFTADRPEWAPPGKYDEKAIALTLLFKYGYGMPFARLEKLQGHLKTPYPSSTQWDQILGIMPQLAPVFQEMMKVGAQGDLFFADDTGVKILSEMLESTRNKETQRKGVQTSAIISEWKGNKIVLFFSGYKHAGDNLDDLFKIRNDGLEKPIQMTDALPANTSHSYCVWTAFCLTHARRQFYDIKHYYPDQCQVVLTLFEKLFKNERLCQEEEYDAKARLVFHQTNSTGLMEDMKIWCQQQLKDKKAEPNSSLGKAINYILSHWNELTLFLRQPGVPLENSESERQLKRAILNRKNAYFFKTMKGAEIGSICMSVVATCEENKMNPLDYLVFLQKEGSKVTYHPEHYLPWNLQSTENSLEVRQEILRQSPAIPA